MNPCKKSNRVQETSSESNDEHVQNPVEVYCRIKPITNSVPCITVQSSTQLSIISPVSLKIQKIINCKFNHIFTEKSDQKKIFDDVAKPLLKGFLQGENGLLLTYGVTGSGKTYSMCGAPNNLGIIPRCIYTLFNSINHYQTPKFLLKSDKFNGFELQDLSDVIIDQEKDVKARQRRKKNANNSWDNLCTLDCTLIDDVNKKFNYTVFVSYVEIYNNQTYDLLDDTSGVKSLQTKILREDCNNNIYVNGVVEIEVKSAKETIELYCLGNKRKRMGQTYLNEKSSRSHSIFTIRLVTNSNNSVKGKNSLKVCQLSLVDLAGSERCNRAMSCGQRLKEAGSINNSLMALRNCLEILRENQKTNNHRLVPYRESRLTLLFKNYFDGEGNVKMLICVNPCAKDYDETVYVMKFSEMSQEVMVSRPIIKITEHEEVEQTNVTEADKDFIELIPIPMNVTLSVPKVRILTPENDKIHSLILSLKTRRHQMTLNKKILYNMGDEFQSRLNDFEAEINNYERRCKYLLSKEREKVKDLKEQVINIKCKYDQLQEKYSEKEMKIDELQRSIQLKDFQIKLHVERELQGKWRRRAILKIQTKPKVENESVNDEENNGHISCTDTSVPSDRKRRSRSLGESLKCSISYDLIEL